MKTIETSMLKQEFKGQQVDYVITCSSFENRSLTLISEIKDLDVNKLILFATIDFDEKIEANRTKMIDIVGKEKAVLCNLKISDPVFSFKNIVSICDTIFKDDSKIVLIDITTFTHELLLILLRVIFKHKRYTDKIYISYTEAKDYSYNVDSLKDKWLTKGVKELRSIIGFPGYFDPTKKNHLIILVGFEKERTLKLIEEFDFELVSLAFGAKDSSINSANQSVNEQLHSEIFNLFSNAEKFEISLTDPFLVRDTILEYVKNFEEYNIVIAPMNNKISTIGVGLAAIENNDIQLFYMQANIYNIAAYSETGNKFYFGQLN